MENVFLKKLAQALLATAEGKTRTQTDLIARRALGILKSKRLLSHMPFFLQALEQAHREATGVVAVTVTTARPLNAGQRNSVMRTVSARFGTNIELQELVDPQLLGGFAIRCGETVLDASLRNHLKQLATHLAS